MLIKILAYLKVLLLCKLLHWHDWERSGGGYYMTFKAVDAYFLKRLKTYPSGIRSSEIEKNTIIDFVPYTVYEPVITFICKDCGKRKTIESVKPALDMSSDSFHTDSLHKYRN